MLISIRNFIKGPYSFYKDGVLTTYEEPVHEKWLPGDIVDKETKAVLTRKQARNIVGIVDFTNRTGQGFSPRGIPLYMFHPINPSYPPMIVAAKNNPKENQFAIVNMEHWENKWPRAGIQTIMGAVGNIDVELKAQISAVKMESKHGDLNELIPNCITHEQYDGFAFNIDPDGCQDVDDIISWNENEFSIAIADVSAWIDENSELNMYAEQTAQTVYDNGSPILPMLPENVSANLASLRSDNRARPVLALVFTFVNNTIQKRWAKRLVKVNKTYTYDSVLEDIDVSKKLKDYLQKIHGTSLSSSDKCIGEDPHHWIEIAMILYNTEAAVLLKEHKLGLLRSQPEGRNAEEWQDLADKTGVPELKFLGYGSGKYVPSSIENAKHVGMGLDVYCHASSPLRRYADLYNQRCLKHILFGESKPDEKKVNWHQLNERAAQIKLLDRELWFLRNLKPKEITTVEGILLKQREDDWAIYIPCWKRKIHGKTDQQEKASVGQRVTVRAYTNLNAVKNRIVCSFKGVQ
jgi:hypothetical protein